jgi:hypothetical protein
MLQRMLIACVLLLASAAVSPSQAGIPIPCTASRLLQAADMPAMRDAKGQEMVLYYAVSGCSDGRWDGYRGRDGKYYSLAPSLLSSIPAAPGFWASAWQNKTKFWVEWLWMVIAAFVVIGTLLSKLAGADAAGALGPGGQASAVRRR